MPIKSQFASKCKDCGTEYDIGDEIDTNGNKSPNKAGELKDHWCINGKNCQGVMQLQGGDNPSNRFGGNAEANPPSGSFAPWTVGDSMTAMRTPDPNVNPVKSDEPTPEEILAFVKQNSDLTEETTKRIIHEARVQAVKVLLEKAGIENVMNEVGIKHPSRVSFMGEVMRRLS